MQQALQSGRCREPQFSDLVAPLPFAVVEDLRVGRQHKRFATRPVGAPQELLPDLVAAEHVKLPSVAPAGRGAGDVFHGVVRHRALDEGNTGLQCRLRQGAVAPGMDDAVESRGRDDQRHGRPLSEQIDLETAMRHVGRVRGTKRQPA